MTIAPLVPVTLPAPVTAPVSRAYRVSGPVPALLHEDPLFLELCAALDEMLSPLVAALDCFAAYLDPALAPAGFLAWLGSLVGADGDPASGSDDDRGSDSSRSRALIAGAVAGYRVRGTPDGLRQIVATATGLAARHVRVTESGGVTISQSPGAVAVPPFSPVVEIALAVPAGHDPDAAAARARAAAGPAIPVFSQLQVTVVKT